MDSAPSPSKAEPGDRSGDIQMLELDDLGQGAGATPMSASTTADESLGPTHAQVQPLVINQPAPRWPAAPAWPDFAPAEPQVAPIVTVQPSPLPQRAVSADIIVVDQPRMPTPGPVGGAEPAAPSTTASMAVAPSAQPSQTVAPLPVIRPKFVYTCKCAIFSILFVLPPL